MWMTKAREQKGALSSLFTATCRSEWWGYYFVWCAQKKCAYSLVRNYRLGLIFLDEMYQKLQKGFG